MPRSVKQEMQGVLQEQELRLLVQPTVRMAGSLHLMEIPGEGEIHLQPGEGPVPEQVDTLKSPWESCAGPGCRQDLWISRRRMLAAPERLHHMGETHTGAGNEELLPRGKNHGEVCGELSPVGGTLHWNMEQSEKFSPQWQEQNYMMN